MNPTLPAGAAAAVADGTNAINFSWLIRLRWGAFTGQAVTIFIVYELMGIDLPLTPLIAVVALELASNVACMFWARAATDVEQLHLALIMAFDILLLTVLLYFTGGPFNPFNFLYLVHIALAAVVLKPGYTWPLLALSLACFGLLFADHVSLAMEHVHGGDESHVGLHLRGMWVAFGVAGVFVAYFVQRVRRSLAERDAELARERSSKAKSEKLASLAALAAGAAHELSTPLSTIAVIAKELEREIERRRAVLDAGAGPGTESLAEDARLIREEVERCRTILLQLAADAGHSAGEPIVRISVRELIDAAVAELKDVYRDGIVLEDGAGACELEIPRRAVTQALRAVVRNARQASRPGDPVVLISTKDGASVRLEVRDRGSGMSPDDLARAGEPFFTTKEPGKGMGLGLFLTRAVLERLGGRLELSSELGRGTRATLVLPLEKPAPAEPATIRRVAVEGVQA